MSGYEMEKFEEGLKEKIYSIRGFQVMLDFCVLFFLCYQVDNGISGEVKKGK